jgi:hypothetical protein
MDAALPEHWVVDVDVDVDVDVESVVGASAPPLPAQPTSAAKKGSSDV